MMTTIYLRGEMGRLFGRKHRMAVSTPAEAARALEANFGNFFKYLFDSKDRGVAFQVFVGKDHDGEDATDIVEAVPGALSEEELKTKCAGRSITFAPVLQGAKEQGVLQVIIGVIIIIVATVVSKGTLTAQAVAATFGGGGMAGFAANFGLAMALGGVATMVAGSPKGPSMSGERADNRPSDIFNGPTNRTRQGNVYPIVYGEMIVGSQRVSAGITNENAFVPGSNRDIVQLFEITAGDTELVLTTQEAYRLEGIQVGMMAAGPGIPSGTYVVAVNTTSVTIDYAPTESYSGAEVHFFFTGSDGEFDPSAGGGYGGY